MEIVEIAPDLWEAMKEMKTKRRKKLSNEEIAEAEEEEGTPLRGMFCLKTRQEDMKPFEEKEDCFILDFDPSDSFDSSFPENPEGGDDDDVAIIHEKGQVLVLTDSWVLLISCKVWVFRHYLDVIAAFRWLVGTSHIQGISA